MTEDTGSAWVGDDNLALLTDLYELTMSASYLRRGMTGPATFDLFIRTLPTNRNFLVSCGLEDALSYLENVRFTDDAIAYLRSTGLFHEDFLEYLAGFRFTGEVWAIPEGEIVFGAEPLLRITAPLIEAQFVETFLLNVVTFQTMIASKAARVAIACRDKSFVDFSLRRDHGADAGLKAARAAYAGGASATSNVLAGRAYGIPLSGTMAHSYVMAFDREIDAFRAYTEEYGANSVLLIDTFDIVAGARNAATVAREMQSKGTMLRGVRIDSGDLGDCAVRVRRVLDDAGLGDVEIIASGDLDEYRIAELLDHGAPIDSFGVGTQLGTSGDAPFLGTAYKLVEDAGGPKMKLSTGKVTLPHRKQVYRVTHAGDMERDVITHEDEEHEGRPLLQPVMVDGHRSEAPRSLADIRDACRRSLESLPAALRSLDEPADYPVELSSRLEGIVRTMKDRAPGG